MGYEKVPPLAVMQRLFADRWWANGGRVAEAVDFAGYTGLDSPSAKSAKGRKLLDSKPVRAYIDYLRRKDKQERLLKEERAAKIAATAAAKAAVEAARDGDIKRLSDLVSGSSSSGEVSEPDVSARIAEVREQAQQAYERKVATCEPIKADTSLGGGAADKADIVAGSSSVAGPEASCLRVTQDVTPDSGMLLPPTIVVPAAGAAKYGPELTPQELREILARVARGDEYGMKDARVRLKAIELAMRNMGMLVDLSVKASLDASNERKQLTEEERTAEIKKLEGYIAKVKKANLSE